MMKRLVSKLRDLVGSRDDDPRDALASLLLTAREDEAFRRQMLFLLRAPPLQRQSLVNTALHEMTLRGESERERAAFARRVQGSE
jgi:hypothetical protein